MSNRKYLLLTAVSGKDFGITNKELVKVIHDAGCQVETTEDINGITKLFVVSKELGSLESFVTDQEIKGLVVEYTAIFDQSVEEE